MDGTDEHSVEPRNGSDAARDRIADEFARIMGHTDESPEPVPRTIDADDRHRIDVATYLLNPPPSAELVARRARRQRWVGVASLISCVVLTIVLVVPWPGAGEEPAAAAASGGADAATSVADSGASADARPSEPATATSTRLPQRLDVPGQPSAAQRVDARPKRTRRTDRAAVATSGSPVAPRPSTVAAPATTVVARPPVRSPAPAQPTEAAPAPLLPLS